MAATRSTRRSPCRIDALRFETAIYGREAEVTAGRKLLVAGVIDVDDVMRSLSVRRTVFHSEADFQHAFGHAIHDLGPDLHIRLEVRQDNAEYLDLLCFGASGRTAIEFKYATARWAGTDGLTNEAFQLRNHAATDLMRRNFVFDIARLERFCAGAPGTNGLAILLTNESNLWREPSPTRKRTRDHEYRIHQGAELTGTLKWADGLYPSNARTLIGSHLIQWQPFSVLPGQNGEFNWTVAGCSPTSS